MVTRSHALGNLRDRWGIAATACAIAWLCQLVLSGTFFVDCENVAWGPLFSLLGCATAAVASILSRGRYRLVDSVFLERRALQLFFIAGFLVFVSGFVTIASAAMVLAAGAAGIGALLLVIALVQCALFKGKSGAVPFLTAPLAAGIVLFLAAQAMTPPDCSNIWSVAFPSLGLLFSFLGSKPTREEVELPTAARGRYIDVFEKRTFAGFAFSSGFLLSFCFNAFPKSFRFIGAFGRPVLGYVGEADLFLLLATVFFASAIAFAFKLERRFAVVVPYSIVGLIVFAFGLAFSLAFLGKTWIPAALLASISSIACLINVVGSVSLLASDQTREMSRRILAALLLGLFFGSLVAFVYIARTVSPIWFSATPFEDAALFDGTALVGFAAMSVTGFLSAWHAKIPDRRGAVAPRVEPLDIAQRCERLSREYDLSPREQEILALLAQGRSGPYIQEELYIAKSTVKTHVRHIYDKVGVSSRQELLDTLHRI